jgi:enolase
MTTITSIQAREILDSRGNPTIEVELTTKNTTVTASVPSGASRGIHEAVELRDGNKRYGGMGVRKAVRNINKKIFPLLQGMDCTRQREIDTVMIENDGTENKKKLGANAILAVSLVCCKAGAASTNLPLYQYINQLLALTKPIGIPKPYFNVINGGRHSDSRLQIQEFMLIPQLKNFTENLRAGSEIYHTLKRDLHKKYGHGTTNIGDEGGFVPKLHKTVDVLKIINKSIKDAGYKNKVKIAMDCAASEFYKKNRYYLDGRKFTSIQLRAYYLQLIKRFPAVVSLEDPFQQDDFIAHAQLTAKSHVQVVGDDLTVSNPERLEEAIREKSATCLLLKVNQIGTLTEALDAIRLAYKHHWKVIVSHRSGETEDTFIADLAVGIGCHGIKSGAPARGERTVKYNRLLRIEEKMKDGSSR